jgi:hypothetical protein
MRELGDRFECSLICFFDTTDVRVDAEPYHVKGFGGIFLECSMSQKFGDEV